MLPPPKNINFKFPEFNENDFLNPKGEEDETLLATGGWKNDDLVNSNEANEEK